METVGRVQLPHNPQGKDSPSPQGEAQTGAGHAGHFPFFAERTVCLSITLGNMWLSSQSSCEKTQILPKFPGTVTEPPPKAHFYLAPILKLVSVFFPLAGLNLLLRLASNLQFSCLILPSTGIIGLN